MRYTTKKAIQGFGITVIGVLCLLASASAFAQQKIKYSFSGTAPGKYTEQHVLDVGDMPGHQIRAGTISTKYSAEAPIFNGAGSYVRGDAWPEIDHVLSNAACKISDARYVSRTKSYELAGTPASLSDHAALVFLATALPRGLDGTP